MTSVWQWRDLFESQVISYWLGWFKMTFLRRGNENGTVGSAEPGDLTQQEADDDEWGFRVCLSEHEDGENKTLYHQYKVNIMFLQCFSFYSYLIKFGFWIWNLTSLCKGMSFFTVDQMCSTNIILLYNTICFAQTWEGGKILISVADLACKPRHWSNAHQLNISEMSILPRHSLNQPLTVINRWKSSLWCVFNGNFWCTF